MTLKGRDSNGHVKKNLLIFVLYCSSLTLKQDYRESPGTGFGRYCLI